MKQDTQILYELSRRLKSPYDELFINSAEFGKLLGVSQQSSSRYLTRLESRGLIERKVTGRGQSIRLTERGVEALRKMHTELENFFRTHAEIQVRGRVVKGLGEGAYYIGKYSERLKDALGFEPYQGTLNLDVKGKFSPERAKTIRIEGFKEGNRCFGDITCIPASISHGKSKVDCWIIIPERSHHRDELELIGKFNFRKKLGLRDGDVVEVSFS